MPVVIPIGVRANAGAAGNVFGTEVLIQLAANATRTLGQGVTATAAGTGPAVLMVFCSPNDFVEFTPDSGTTFYTLIQAAAAGLILADGLGNVRLNNVGVADAGVVFTRIYECKWIA